MEAGEVTDFSQDHGAHAAANAWDRGNRRVQFVHDGLDRSFNFFNFSIQFPNEADGMLQFRDLAGILEPMERLAASRISTAISLP